MGNKNLRDQLDGLFSSLPGSGEEKEESPLEDVVLELLEGDEIDELSVEEVSSTAQVTSEIDGKQVASLDRMVDDLLEGEITSEPTLEEVEPPVSVEMEVEAEEYASPWEEAVSSEEVDEPVADEPAVEAFETPISVEMEVEEGEYAPPWEETVSSEELEPVADETTVGNRLFSILAQMRTDEEEIAPPREELLPTLDEVPVGEEDILSPWEGVVTEAPEIEPAVDQSTVEEETQPVLDEFEAEEELVFPWQETVPEARDVGPVAIEPTVGEEAQPVTADLEAEEEFVFPWEETVPESPEDGSVGVELSVEEDSQPTTAELDIKEGLVFPWEETLPETSPVEPDAAEPTLEQEFPAALDEIPAEEEEVASLWEAVTAEPTEFEEPAAAEPIPTDEEPSDLPEIKSEQESKAPSWPASVLNAMRTELTDEAVWPSISPDVETEEDIAPPWLAVEPEAEPEPDELVPSWREAEEEESAPVVAEVETAEEPVSLDQREVEEGETVVIGPMAPDESPDLVMEEIAPAGEEAVPGLIQAEPVVDEIAPSISEEVEPEEEEAVVASPEAQTIVESVEPTMVEYPLPTLADLEEVEPDVSLLSLPAWDATLSEQRSKTLNLLLTALTRVGAVVIVTMLFSLIWRPDMLGTFIPYFAAYLVLAGLTLARSLNTGLRTGILAALSYSIGMYDLVINGPLGFGGVFLLAAPVLLSVMVSQRYGVIAAVASTVVYTAMAIAHHLGLLQTTGTIDLTLFSSVVGLSSIFAMLVAGATLIQRLFSSFLTGTLRESHEQRSEVTRSQQLLERQTDKLTAANELLHKQAVQLQTAAEIFYTASSVLDADDLMQRTVNLIRERFNLYYVGLFLVDEAGQSAVLRAGTGEAGRRMMAQAYEVDVEGESVVGWCITNAQTRMVTDSDSSGLRFSNVLLPYTRLNVALPLRSRDQVIGALDVHSARREVLSKGDLAALQIVTDHVALAIDNALLFTDVQTRLGGSTEQEHYTPEPWASSTSRVAPFHERVRPGTKSLGDPARSGSMTQLGQIVQKAVAQRSVVAQSKGDDGLEQATLVAPIILRGEVIGVLGLHDEDKRQQWTSDEIALISAVADQMALAVENARLIEEAEEQADHERLISEITTRVRASMDVETILRTTVRELGAALGTDRTFIQLGVGSPSIDEE